MANPAIAFLYWYRRYKVRAADMTSFENAMVQTARGFAEGSMGAAVLSGGNVTPASGLSVEVSPAITTAPSGYLGVIAESIQLDVTQAAASGLPCRSLVVVTPMPMDSNYIQSPTSPGTQVPLYSVQEATVVLIPGTPSASPDYPAKGPNDVILCGLIMPAGANSVTQAMLDYEVRDSIGVNSLIAQNQVRFDNRLRPYRSAPGVLGIKPSQNIGSAPLAFSYPGRLTPSLFPKTAGAFTPQDTFVDFANGTISGGDATTPAFTPSIPSGNNSLVGVVTLTQQDTLHINFSGANEGGYAQCLSAIQNQVFSGPGALPAPDGNFGIAYVILTSLNGTLSDIQVFDGRPFLGSGAAAAKFKKETPSGAVNGTNNVFTLSSTPMDPESLDFWSGNSVLEDNQYELNGNVVTITDVSAIPSPGQQVYAKYLVFGAVSNTPTSGVPAAKFRQEVPIGAVNGSNVTFTLSSVPVDPESLDLWVGTNNLELTDYTLTGATIVITNPDFVPQVGQQVYAKYLYLGVISGSGGGGGGTSGYAALGSRVSPVVIPGVSGLTPTMDPLQEWFIKSPMGAQVVTASPQISPGATVGQQLKLKIVDGSNFPYFNDGNGLDLAGPWPATGGGSAQIDGATLALSWDGSYWSEDSRR